MEETNNNNINFDNCNFETIHFYKVGIAEHNDIPITKKYSDVLRETLPGLLPCREVEHKIKNHWYYTKTICNLQAISS